MVLVHGAGIVHWDGLAQSQDVPPRKALSNMTASS